MKKIIVLFNTDFIIVDENNLAITVDDLNLDPSMSALADSGLMSLEKQDYLDVILNYEHDELMSRRLSFADELKKNFPHIEVSFLNDKKYYDLPVDNKNYSIIPDNFDISQHILTKYKYIRVMFDYCATGVWDYNGACVPLEWIPVSETTRNLVRTFQKGLDQQRIIYDEHEEPYTTQEEIEIQYYSDLVLKAAIALKKELPQWTIELHNYSTYDIEVDEYNNSDISSDMTFEEVEKSVKMYLH